MEQIPKELLEIIFHYAASSVYLHGLMVKTASLHHCQRFYLENEKSWPVLKTITLVCKQWSKIASNQIKCFTVHTCSLDIINPLFVSILHRFQCLQRINIESCSSRCGGPGSTVEYDKKELEIVLKNFPNLKQLKIGYWASLFADPSIVSQLQSFGALDNLLHFSASLPPYSNPTEHQLALQKYGISKLTCLEKLSLKFRIFKEDYFTLTRLTKLKLIILSNHIQVLPLFPPNLQKLVLRGDVNLTNQKSLTRLSSLEFSFGGNSCLDLNLFPELKIIKLLGSFQLKNQNESKVHTLFVRNYNSYDSTLACSLIESFCHLKRIVFVRQQISYKMVELCNQRGIKMEISQSYPCPLEDQLLLIPTTMGYFSRGSRFKCKCKQFVFLLPKPEPLICSSFLPAFLSSSDQWIISDDPHWKSFLTQKYQQLLLACDSKCYYPLGSPNDSEK